MSDGPTLRQRLARLRVDVTPLRTSRDFRRLFAAGTVFYIGAMVSYVALPYQIYQLTGSNFAVGAMALVELVPLVVFGLYGGALADHVDRRKMLVLCGIAQVVLTAGLLGNALLDDPSVWAIYVVGFLLTIAQSLQRPSREALLPRVVRHDEMAAATAVASLGMQVGTLLGPALGGVLVATAGVAVGVRRRRRRAGRRDAAVRVDAALPADRAVDAAEPRVASSAASATPSAGATCWAPTSSTWSRCSWRCRSCCSRRSPRRCWSEPGLLGLLYTAESVGTLLATLTSGWTTRFHHHGRAVVVASMCWGGSMALVGLSPNVWFALVFLALAGAADMISGIFRGDDLEPDDPRRAARPAGRHRDALLLARARWAARPGPAWSPT